MGNTTSDPWFARKSFGWGWGFPITWQGWLSLALYIAVAVGIGAIIGPRANTVLWLAFFVPATVAFVALCWWKGETPGWHWGD